MEFVLVAFGLGFLAAITVLLSKLTEANDQAKRWEIEAERLKSNLAAEMKARQSAENMRERMDLQRRNILDQLR